METGKALNKFLAINIKKTELENNLINKSYAELLAKKINAKKETME